MFPDFAYADRDGDRWIEIADWDSVRAERHAVQGVQVWTRNTIYELDHSLRCVGATDRATGESHPDHPLIGQHLVGNFGQDPGRALLEEALPEIGRAAVFAHLSMRPATLRRTSIVERLRVRMRPARVREESGVERLSEPFGEHLAKAI